MLKELKIENLAIIDEIDINLEKGLTVLTGETGAGKSIILDGLSLIIGEKANKEMIGKNSEKVTVEAVFNLDEEQIEKLNDLDYEFNDELIISREFGIDNKVRVNNKRFTLSNLKEISSNVLDLVGQHDHQYLLNSNYHLYLLDKFLDKDSLKIKSNMKEYISKIDTLNEEIEIIKKEKSEVIEKRNLYEYIVDEIFKHNLEIDEDEELENEYNELFNSGIITDKLTEILDILDFSSFKKVKKDLEKLSEYSNKYDNLTERFNNVYEELNDMVDELSSSLTSVDNNPYRLEEVNDRLNIIKKLKIKYGSSIKEILEYGENIKHKLELIESSDETLYNKEKELEENIKGYTKLSKKLSILRKDKAKTLKDSVMKELKELNMPQVVFDIEFTEIDRININGNDGVKFLISTNKGEKLKDLSKIASGGEISRIMLALKIVFSKVDHISCLIFDEIDTGISGETVIKIANKLKELSNNVQIICVTHSPQIAAKANNQFLIYKESDEKNTRTKIKKLDTKERVREIARILSGDNITKASLEIAKEMMK
ncbi:DNA repair protein RecN [Streptobacillus moniliformis]|uniref:DNA repair protein RecN n=1 Tax=Streptobacillus moniliformis (strain ATCC 14647 / DSM 12112 / NCTC 10651 / 9901) TaxID=519441 RepID=D1AX12_STRM9|nr:DNA repair protein RecN [Streptobacillus moniliformis]ACZ00838.1 DNA repair protein RecN [Streptobacillus moniliformis DSM 12112]AVL42768.1 DNA repair protein RecN [Streptobacillus moniliformis]QXW65588.1 DNA repair protein RecN [Streptobacillus moniliformis]SQA14027.1 Recombination protein N [Streptobacillus moniliformis]